MKNKIFCTVWVIFLSCSTIHGQEEFQKVQESDWSHTISYIAAKITNWYIQESIDKKRISKGDSIAYLNFKEELANNTLDYPINPDSLQNYLKKQFSLTNEKLTARILAWQSLEPQDKTVLFDSLSSLLSDRKSDIQNSSKYFALKEEVFSNYHIPPPDQPTPINHGEPTDNNNGQTGSLWHNLLLFQVLTGVFLLSTIIFFFIWLHVRNTLRETKAELKKKEDELKNSKKENNRSNSTQFQNASTNSFNTPQRKTEKTIKIEKSSSDHLSKSPKDITDKDFPQENLNEIEKTSPASVEIEPVPQVLFAGKPTPKREFQELKNDKEENHIYKLTLLDDMNAEFELVDLSNYMKTEVINSPDDYLYRVCHHENDNTDFTNEIITIRKGTAQKIDSKWQVNEENKAIIKFH